MLRYCLTRLASSVAAILGASVITFVFLRLVPGNPARLILGPFASDGAVRELIASLGLNDSIPAQYWHYLTSFLAGDWGYSQSTGEAVSQALGDRFPATLELGLFAFAVAGCGALLLGLLSAYRPRRAVEAGVQIITAVGLGVPQFWLALLALMVLSQDLGLFPGPDGRLGSGVTPPPQITGLYTVDALLAGRPGLFVDALWHLVLPGMVLALTPLAYMTRILRASLFEVRHEPYMMVVEGKGVSPRATYLKHAFPNAAVPLLTSAGLVFGQLIGGSVLVEVVFRWPGIGALVTDSVLQQDYSVVQVFILLSAVAYVVINLLVDWLAARIDPRQALRTPAA